MNAARLRLAAGIMGLSVLFSAPAAAQPTQNPANGHYYDLVVGAFSFTDAQTGAASQVFMSMSGHLATITSQSENDFITNTFGRQGTADFAWFGGSDQASEGAWLWVVGPEAGVQFSSGSTPTLPDSFAPWGGPEPNNASNAEHYAVVNLGDLPQPISNIQPGEWGDTKIDGGSGVVGYVVEFSVVSTAVPGEAVQLEVALSLLFPGLLEISYVPACDAVDHTIYYGPLGGVSSYNYTGAECSIGTTGAATFDPGGLPSAFFLVVGEDGIDEGSYGTSSAMMERPEDVGTIGCDRPQNLPGVVCE